MNQVCNIVIFLIGFVLKAGSSKNKGSDLQFIIIPIGGEINVDCRCLAVHPCSDPQIKQEN